MNLKTAVIFLVALCVPLSAMAAMQMFLQLDDIEGESTDVHHEDWIDILEFSHVISQPLSSSTSGSRTAGRCEHGDLIVVKELDKATPKLHLYCSQARHIPKAVLEFVEPTPRTNVFYRIELRNVIVSGISPSGITTNTLPVEQMSLRYDSLSLQSGVSWEYLHSPDPTNAAAAFVDITNRPSGTLSHSTTNFVISGTNRNVTGEMWWYNAAARTRHYFSPAASAWNETVTHLQVGLNAVSVYGTNSSGSLASDTIVIKRAAADEQPLVVTITNASPVIVPLATSATAIGGTNTPSVEGQMWWTNTTAGTGARFAPGAPSWSVNVAGLKYGLNEVYVYGSNKLDQLTYDVVSIRRGTDLQFAAVDVTNAPLANLDYGVTTYDMLGTNNTYVSGSMWWSNVTNQVSGVIPRSGTNWSAKVTDLEVGLNVVYVYATNALGYRAYDTVSFTREQEGAGPPYVDITNVPPTNLSYDVTLYDISGTNNLQVAGSMWWSNVTNQVTGIIPRSGTNWSATVANLEVGLNVVYVYATNAWDQQASDVVSIMRNAEGTGLPYVDITNATLFDLEYADKSVDISGTNNLQVAGDMWWSNITNQVTGIIPRSGTDWSVTVTNLSTGPNTVYVFASNQWRQTAHDVCSVFRAYSPGAPVVDITNASPLEVGYGTAGRSLSGTNNSFVTGDMWWLNASTEKAGTVSRAGTNWTAYVTSLGWGANSVYVFATNALGIKAWDVITIRRDYPPGTRFVSLAGAHTHPYTNWTGAATHIQAAVDASNPGDLILVAPGAYSVGSRVLAGGRLMNRLVVTNGVHVQSVDGPEYTLIEGEADPLGNGPNGVRCAYVGPDSVLAGFTLMGGHTRAAGGVTELNGGGVYLDGGGVVSNCAVVGGSAASVGGGVYCRFGGTVRECEISGNSAALGGGVYCVSDGSLRDCVIAGNSAQHGGGVYLSSGGTVSDSLIEGNFARRAGGVMCASGGSLEACTLRGNTADGNEFDPGGSGEDDGGGGVYCMDGGSLRNCVISANLSVQHGGGVYHLRPGSEVVNCTISDNEGVTGTGGVYGHDGGMHLNSIVYFNRTGMDPYDFDGFGMFFDFCCLPSDPGGGDNITDDPMFADPNLGDYRLQQDSQCIDSALDDQMIIADRDGIPRPLDGNNDGQARWDRGAHEFVFWDADTDRDTLLDGWEVGVGLDPTIATGLHGADGDPDGDGMDNSGEQAADTHPLDEQSALEFVSMQPVAGGPGVEVTYRGGREAWQFLLVKQDLNNPAEPWVPIFTNIPPTDVTNVIIDAGATNGNLFYRIKARRNE